jgi:hypothetical protein
MWKEPLGKAALFRFQPSFLLNGNAWESPLYHK